MDGWMDVRENKEITKRIDATIMRVNQFDEANKRKDEETEKL